MTDCPNAEMRDRLPDLLHERLDANARAAVVAHVDECADCRAELALLREVRVSLSSGILAVDAASIARVVVARTAPQRAIGGRHIRWPGWRLAAAAAVVLVGGTSLAALYAMRGEPNGNGHTSGAAVAAAPFVDTTGHTKPRSVIEAPPQVASGAPDVPKSSGELAAAGDVSDLSQSELRALLGDLETIEAVPSTEPEPVTVRVSLPDRGGTD